MHLSEAEQVLLLLLQVPLALLDQLLHIRCGRRRREHHHRRGNISDLFTRRETCRESLMLNPKKNCLLVASLG